MSARKLASAYLGLGIKPGGSDDANSEQEYGYYLYARVLLAPNPPSDHCSYAASRPQNDMNRYGNVVAKGMVIERVDAEEQYYVDKPALQWDLVRTEEKGWSRFVELRDVASDGHEEELDEGQECTTGGFDPIQHSIVSDTRHDVAKQVHMKKD